jgi:hypothetical protein
MKLVDQMNETIITDRRQSIPAHGLIGLRNFLVLLFFVTRFTGTNGELRGHRGKQLGHVANAENEISNEPTGNTTRRLALAPCHIRSYDFSKGFSTDWDQQTTQSRQNLIDGVWALHSRGTGADNWSRMRYSKYTFNNNAQAYTRIKVQVRGAPDGGKNSNAYLIQSKGDYSLNGAVQDGTKDEIDFFEYYGGSNAETIHVFRAGKTVAGYPQTLLEVNRAGNELYTYEMILKNAERSLLVMVYNSAGKEIVRRQLQGDSVPTKGMELFIGIWDCSGGSYCPGKVDYDTWMGVKSVLIEAC